ncbi:uncharacterized protein LOC121732309 [Aricia agestis]|uniref:uncharacterized protein LOC121732309 n=1 Tax=Aricia agestis TaxID=91739 RepID=UPI001C2089BB|nr:uncharacterized protein LOC121732309 [Aricia agestis]
MAVSHHWFVQWSSPPILLADISREYQHIDSKWNINTFNNGHESLRDTRYETQYLSEKFRQTHINKDYRSKLENEERARLTGVTLWMTMLGLTNTWPTLDTPPFATLYRWKQIDFHFLSENHRRNAIQSEAYIPENVLPLGLEVWGSRIWVTFPSWRKGVPATLGTVSRLEGTESPLVQPYPDWKYHRASGKSGNCTGLTSVFRINVDQCGRLWVLDSGQIDSQNEPKQLCPPSIVVFDLVTDMIIARYIIPKKYVLQDSLFSNIVVDSRESDCSDLHLYITDTWRFGLLVFRESDASFWRFTHHYFYPDPFSSNYTLHGLNFQWTDGIFGLALTPTYFTNERLLFFHSMSGDREFFVKTSVLQNPLSVNSSAEEFKSFGETRGPLGQSSASAIDRRGVMFYGMVIRDTVGCWDTRKPYLKRNLGVVAKNVETLVFPNDIKVDQETKQNVWVISNKLPIFQDGSLDPEDYNYRILYADTTQAVRGTVCDPTVPSSPPTQWTMLAIYLVVAILLTSNTKCYCTNKNAIGTLYRWKQIDFAYSSEQERQTAIQNGDFIQPNVVPLGIERWKNRVFVSTPRWKKGIPATLSVLPVPAEHDSPQLVPYPNWGWQSAGNCSGFTSIFRMSIDDCGVMWALDSGQVEGFESPRQICPPTIFAIDLATDTVLAKLPLPDRFVLQDSLITNIVTDSRDPQCKDLHIYIADVRRYGLIVLRVSDASFWRFNHYTFYPEPLLSNYTLHGVNFQWPDGIFGMSVDKKNNLLYYHSMSSANEFVVSTSVIRDPSRVDNSIDEFKLLGENRGAIGQVSAAAIDANGVMFFNLVSQDSIACWNTLTDYRRQNLGVVARNNFTLVFPNDLRVDHESPQVIWIISNRLPMYQFNLLNPNEYNFRIIYLHPTLAIQNTVCDPQYYY